MAQPSRPTSISFEDFTSTTLRSIKSVLDTKPNGPRVFWDPEIICGIIIRPPRDIALPELGNIAERGGR